MRTYLNIINIILVAVYIVLILPLWGGSLRPSEFTSASGNPFKRHVVSQRKQSMSEAKVLVVDLLMPGDYNVLKGLLNFPDVHDPGDIEPYRLYYQELTRMAPLPYSADAYAMLGFCHYHEGKIEESFENYKKSLEQNPMFLWTYYNLALIHFKNENYDKVVELLEGMLRLNAEISLGIIVSSKIYADILGAGGIDLVKDLKKTYGDAMRMMAISLYRLNKFPELLNVSQNAIHSGFEPVEVFSFYAAMAAEAVGDREKGETFRQAAGTGQGFEYLGKDLTVRFF